MICLRSEKIEKFELSGVSDIEVNILIVVVSLSHIHIDNVNNFKKIPGKVIDEILKLKPVNETDEPT